MRSKRVHREQTSRATHTMLPSGVPAPAESAPRPRAPAFAGLRRGFLPVPKSTPATILSPAAAPSSSSSSSAAGPSAPSGKPATFGGMKRGFLGNSNSKH